MEGNGKSLDYGSMRKQFLKVVETERFFSEAFESVLKIEDFREYRERRKRAVEALNEYAGQLAGITKEAGGVCEPKERLKIMAPAFERAFDILRDYGAFDRSLTLPNNISDRYAEKLKGYIRLAVRRKVGQGTLPLGKQSAKEGELLMDLMSPAGFFSLESTKMIDYLEAFKEIRARGKWPLDPSILEDAETRGVVAKLAKYNANSAEGAFRDFSNYSGFIGREDSVIEGLIAGKGRLKERRAEAEEYVLSGIDVEEKCGNGFAGTLSALDELRRYEGFEDPQRHPLGETPSFRISSSWDFSQRRWARPRESPST